MKQLNPKIVVIGGGTGSFSVLSGLKYHTNSITALVNMIDDGGSTGQLRDEYGVLPPGDIRQCLVALSDAPQAVRDLFNFRFPGTSGLAGHSFGNLFLSAVEMMSDNFSQAVKVAADVLNIKGRVYPVTLDKCQLVMEVAGDKTIGQSAIVAKKIAEHSKPKLYLEPDAEVGPEALEAIKTADLVVIAPGNLYASIIPTLLVKGISQGLKLTKAPILFICNLVNKDNHTANFAVDDYVNEIERFIGKDTIDSVLYNVDIPSKELLTKYALDGEYPVIFDSKKLSKQHFKAIAGNFLSRKDQSRDDKDIFITRSLIRHNSETVAEAIIKSLN